ncbi:MAG: glycosyl transferase, group 1 [Acidobacteriales bacterium]|nr:glycosyl transferase, group 1 [Terriglobales bacterium]
MRIALISPPFIPVPPTEYGGTELFVAELACGLKKRGIDVVVYANGESTVPVEVRWLYEKSQWPMRGEASENVKDANHAAWAVRDAMESCDVIHVNNYNGLTFSRFTSKPFVNTVHHPVEEALTEFYGHYPDVNHVCISNHQRLAQKLSNSRVIHHGIDLTRYMLQKKKKGYLSFIGRIAPVKGTHLAIEVAQKAGIPLKIAGEIQPAYQDYFDTQVKPLVDGKFIEFIGKADLAAKNELLGDSMAMLFPIQWDEPFGLVMVEAMACGTPVLALPGGSVSEIVKDRVSGYVCESTDEMVARLAQMEDHNVFSPAAVRKYVETEFSLDGMVSAYIELYEQVLSRKANKVAVSGSSQIFLPESAVA